MNGDWQVVDQLGRVHVSGLSRDDANGAMIRLVEMMPNLAMHTERKGHKQEPTPATIATAAPLPAIESGSERHALREAIEAQLDAAARLDSANQAVERARAFTDARQVELDALRAAHADEIRHAGVNLAETLKTGGTLETNRVIDRSALLDAETRLATAKAALDQLTAEQKESDSAHTATETAIRLAVLAVKRADVAAMVERMEAVKAEFMGLATAIDAARFADVPMTQRSQEATRIIEPSAGAISEAAARWHRYSAVLREDPQAAWEGQQ